jgi:acyl-CoA thioesterase-1
MVTDMQIPLMLHRHFNRLVLGLISTGFCGLLWANSGPNNPAKLNQQSAEKTVLIVGDSLSAEYGLTRGSGWAQLMSQQALQEALKFKLVNASISGDTTSGGVSRLPSLLKQHQPDVLVIELGGNDALRGLSLQMTQNNLMTMATEGKKAGAKVLVVAMQVPPNYGSNYRQQMDAIYLKVSKETGSQLNTNFLKGVADDPDPLKWFQADRIHPNEAAQSLMMKNIWPQIKKLLQNY